MIEIFSARGTRSFGCFASFKTARGTLDSLARTGALGAVPSVAVCSYRNGTPQREYTATLRGGKWRTPRPVKDVSRPQGRRTRRRKFLCKVYASPEECFREGFPDWMNRSYPVPVLKRQGLYLHRHFRSRI